MNMTNDESQLKHESQSSQKCHYGVLALILFTAFMIGANRAWLNPHPQFEVIKIPQSIPFLWQYNPDAPTELASAAYFPEFFEDSPIRMSRPGYPLIVNIFGKIIGILAYPVIQLHSLEQAAAGYVLLKWLIYALSCFLFYRGLSQMANTEVALLSCGLLFLHPFAIDYMTTFHTSELQFISPIFLMAMFFNLGQRYTIIKNILFSLLTGYLILGKQNYALYAALLVFAFVKGYWKEALLSGLVHLLPNLLWIAFIYINGMEYYDHGAEAYGQGVWLYKELIFMPPLEMLKTLWFSWHDYLVMLARFYSLWLIAAIPFLLKLYPKNKRLFVQFLVIVLFMHWFQTFAAKRFIPYMASDIAFLVFPAAAIGFIQFLNQFKFRFKHGAIALLAIWTLAGVLSFTHFPWVHPANQPERSISEKVEGKYKEYNVNLDEIR